MIAEASSVAHEIAALRQGWIHRWVGIRLDRRGGDFTTEEYDAWWAEGHRKWRENYPALTALLPTHLPEADR